MCGEKLSIPGFCFVLPGSPPHVRGKGHNCPTCGRSAGITPACAGKRKRIGNNQTKPQDHPRMCGEKFCPGVATNSIKGSPPHVRGKANPGGSFIAGVGITPACAGKSSRPTAFCVRCRDHPRMCGEKSIVCPRSDPGTGSPRMCGEKASGQFVGFTEVGSPPHVRGKEKSNKVCFSQTGITPACAGKSSKELPPVIDHRDHPRMCGEKTKKIP